MNIAILFHDDCDDEYLKGGEEQLEVIEGVSHDKKGYTVSRYVFEFTDANWEWDGRYKFYASLEDVVQAFKSKDYKAGEEAYQP
jgi:hypothetical protein